MTELAAIRPPSLNSRHLCIYFLLPGPQKVGILAAVHRKSSPSDETGVKFNETFEGQTGVHVEEDFFQSMVNEIVRELHLKR